MFIFIAHRGTTLDAARTDQLAAVAQVSRVPERPRSSIMHAAALARRRAMLCPQNRAGDQVNLYDKGDAPMSNHNSSRLRHPPSFRQDY